MVNKIFMIHKIDFGTTLHDVIVMNTTEMGLSTHRKMMAISMCDHVLKNNKKYVSYVQNISDIWTKMKTERGQNYHELIIQFNKKMGHDFLDLHTFWRETIISFLRIEELYGDKRHSKLDPK